MHSDWVNDVALCNMNQTGLYGFIWMTVCDSRVWA
jgi:hypothetical protein